MTQKLRLRGNNYHTFVLPKDWIVASTVQFPPTFNSQIPSPSTVDRHSGDPTALLQTSWPSTTGWSQYRKSSLQGVSFSNLRKLTATPTKLTVKAAKGSRQWLEYGLLQIFRMTPEYLQNANTFLDQHHPDIRDAITAGCVFMNELVKSL